MRNLILLLLWLVAAAPASAQVTRASRVPDRAIEELRNQTLSARVVEAAGLPSPVVDISGAVTLAPDQFLAVRTNRMTEITMQADHAIGRLPLEILVPSASGVTETLEVRFESTGLGWNSAAGKFVGEVLLGVVGKDAPSVSGSLATAVQMQVLAPPGSAVSRSDVPITRKGVPFERILLSSDKAQEPFNVRVLASFDAHGDDIAIAVRRPSLRLLVTPTVINGFGLETAELTVTTSEGADARGSVVFVTPARGRAGQTSLVLDASGAARTQIRSDGTGTTEIVVSSGPFGESRVPLQFRFPTPFLAAVGIATLLGSTVWVYVTSTKRKRSKAKRFGDWLIGVIAGFGITIAVFGRVDLSDYLPFLPDDLGTEVTAFGVAFVIALVGVAVSGKIIKSATA